MQYTISIFNYWCNKHIFSISAIKYGAFKIWYRDNMVLFTIGEGKIETWIFRDEYFHCITPGTLFVWEDMYDLFPQKEGATYAHKLLRCLQATDGIIQITDLVNSYLFYKYMKL